MSHSPSDLGRLLAGPHNSRLGPAVHAFNLPVEPSVCSGASPTCSSACYAKGFLFQLQRKRHHRNLEGSRDARFATMMIRDIRRSMAQVVRIHVSGDFYDADYTRKWAEVARTCSNTTFFAYTRSWRSDAVLAELIDLARFSNVALWFSEDRDSGRSPAALRVRRAYLLANGEPEASVPADADLVFRVPLTRRPGCLTTYAGPSKWANGVLICPKEQGIARRVEMTCSTCRTCFTDHKPRLKPR